MWIRISSAIGMEYKLHIINFQNKKQEEILELKRSSSSHYSSNIGKINKNICRKEYDTLSDKQCVYVQ